MKFWGLQNLWCWNSKHCYFCASEIMWPNFPQFLIPLVKTLIFIGRTKWPKRFGFGSKLTEFFFLDWPKLATWHKLVRIWKAISLYKQIINTFWLIIDLEFAIHGTIGKKNTHFRLLRCSENGSVRYQNWKNFRHQIGHCTQVVVFRVSAP